MIQEIKSTTPVIDFGFGLSSLTALVGVPVTVWLQSLHNKDSYDFSINAADALVIKVSDYQYSITFSTPGIRGVIMNVGTKDKLKGYVSNQITITVQ
jgi:hypothetical protein